MGNKIPPKLTGTELKQILWNTLHELRDNKIPINEAVAVASVSKAIVGVTNAQIKIFLHGDKKISKALIDFAEK